jgi:hypothetical protein
MTPEVKAALVAWCDTLESPEAIASAVASSPNAQHLADPNLVARYLVAVCTGAA